MHRLTKRKKQLQGVSNSQPLVYCDLRSNPAQGNPDAFTDIALAQFPGSGNAYRIKIDVTPCAAFQFCRAADLPMSFRPSDLIYPSLPVVYRARRCIEPMYGQRGALIHEVQADFLVVQLVAFEECPENGFCDRPRSGFGPLERAAIRDLQVDAIAHCLIRARINEVDYLLRFRRKAGMSPSSVI
jgi:hypothetical protein